ncbi:MAG: MaoC/PaaZ C-terminal domain-containing protein [bacterium]
MAAQLYFEDVRVGDPMPGLVKAPVTEVQLVKYAGASGDFNPIHTVHHMAEKAKLGGVIAHGMLIMGFVAQGVTDWLPNRCLRKLKVRFAGITRPGDVITVSGRLTDKRIEGPRKLIVCEITATNQKGETKLAGELEAELPSKER